MFDVPCVRVDVGESDDRSGALEVVDVLRMLVRMLHSNPVARLNVAFTGRAMRWMQALAPDLLDELRELFGLEQVELIVTPHDGALLPLLPAHEIERQLLLDEQALGPLYAGTRHRMTLWPTKLAVSTRVVHTAAHLGFSAVLVDARSIDDAGALEGVRLTATPFAPGVFLIPVGQPARPATETAEMRLRVITFGLSPGTTLPHELVHAMARGRTLRWPDVLELFPKDGVCTLSPGMEGPESTADRPFGAWSATPSVARTGASVERLSAHLLALEHAGLAALPPVRTARRSLDGALGADRWLSVGIHEALDLCAAALAQAPRAFDQFDVRPPSAVL